MNFDEPCDLRMYQDALARIPKLTPAEAKALAATFQAGLQRALEAPTREAATRVALAPADGLNRALRRRNARRQ